MAFDVRIQQRFSMLFERFEESKIFVCISSKRYNRIPLICTVCTWSIYILAGLGSMQRFLRYTKPINNQLNPEKAHESFAMKRQLSSFGSVLLLMCEFCIVNNCFLPLIRYNLSLNIDEIDLSIGIIVLLHSIESWRTKEERKNPTK